MFEIEECLEEQAIYIYKKENIERGQHIGIISVLSSRSCLRVIAFPFCDGPNGSNIFVSRTDTPYLMWHRLILLMSEAGYDFDELLKLNPDLDLVFGDYECIN